MNSKRLGQICSVLAQNSKRFGGARDISKSALGKELLAWFNEPAINLPIDWPAELVPVPIPIRFEDEYPNESKILISLFDAGKIVRIDLTNKKRNFNL